MTWEFGDGPHPRIENDNTSNPTTYPLSPSTSVFAPRTTLGLVSTQTRLINSGVTHEVFNILSAFFRSYAARPCQMLMPLLTQSSFPTPSPQKMLRITLSHPSTWNVDALDQINAVRYQINPTAFYIMVILTIIVVRGERLPCAKPQQKTSTWW